MGDPPGGAQEGPAAISPHPGLTLKGSGFPPISPGTEERSGGVLPMAWPCLRPPVPPPTATDPTQGEPRLPNSPAHCSCPTHPKHCPAHPSPAPMYEPRPPFSPAPSPFLCFRDLDLRGELGFCKERGVLGGSCVLPAPPALPRTPHLIRFPLLCYGERHRKDGFDLFQWIQPQAQSHDPHIRLPFPCAPSQERGSGAVGQAGRVPHPSGLQGPLPTFLLGAIGPVVVIDVIVVLLVTLRLVQVVAARDPE